MLSTDSQRLLENILDKATKGYSLSNMEICYLLSIKDYQSINKIMYAARQVRERHFGNKVFLYGFIYFSTYCRNSCSFCFYRKSNQLSPRYRKSLKEVTEIACRLKESGVHLVDLTMGEDPLIHDIGRFDILLEMVSRVKEGTGLPIMLSPGVVPDDVIKSFAKSQVDWYALYQETHNPILYQKLRVNQSFEERCSKRRLAYQAGMLVEDGMLIGVGENYSDQAEAIVTMKSSPVQQVRVMSLVPQPETPLAEKRTPPRLSEYLNIAVMRLMMPDRLIPASLDIDGIKGLEMRLNAGANVVTSIIPSSNQLAGVSSTLDIEQGYRSVPEVKKVLSSMGMKAADTAEYILWMRNEKAKTKTA